MTSVPDFKREALLAAVNEACEPQDAVWCSIELPCPACKALGNAIEARLVRAFLAGQASVSQQATLITPHRS